jgi:hypothetical protein
MTTPPDHASQPLTQRQHPTSGIVALVMGIVGLVALPLIGPIIALVFGYQSRREAQVRPDLYSDDFGRVGRILGWIGLALAAVGILAVVLGLLFFVAIPA